MELKTLFLFLFFALVQNFASAALGIAKDDTPKRYFHWSAAHSFAQDEETLHAALPSLARQAYEEMIADAKVKNTRSDRIPGTMAAFAVGTDVYFSSSVKGGPFLLNPRKPDGVEDGVAEEVKLAIIRCQQVHENTHRYGASCAEPLAIQQFLVNKDQASVKGKGKVSTYGNLSPGDATKVGIMDPCSVKDGKWGCSIFIEELQVTRVGKQGDQPDLPSIEPANALPHCFW